MFARVSESCSLLCGCSLYSAGRPRPQGRVSSWLSPGLALPASPLSVWAQEPHPLLLRFHLGPPLGGHSPLVTAGQLIVVVVQSLSRVQLFAIPRTAVHQPSMSITNSQSLIKFMSLESVMPSNHLILCCPLPLMHSILPSIRVFPNESVLHIRWPKYWSFSFSISSSNEYSGLISCRIDWFDLLAVQGTLKSLFQHHSSKASVLQYQLSLWSSSHIHT